MFTMYRQVLAALSLVGLFTRSTQAMVIKDAELFGADDVFDPIVNLVGQSPSSHRLVRDVVHCENAKLFFPPGKRLIALRINYKEVLRPMDATDAQKKSSQALLAQLASNSNNEVWVVSARNIASLQKQYGDIPGVNLAAEHGTVLQRCGKPVQSAVIDGVQETREAVKPIAKKYEHIGMSLFDDTQNAVVFKYDRKFYETDDAKAALEEVRRALLGKSTAVDANAALEEVRRALPLQILREGNAWGEIKDPRIDKGNFVAKLLQSDRFASGIAMGDQITDEGMFRAMNKFGFHSVIVSQNPSQETHAKNKLNDVEQVHSFLRHYLVRSSGDAV